MLHFMLSRASNALLTRPANAKFQASANSLLLFYAAENPFVSSVFTPKPPNRVQRRHTGNTAPSALQDEISRETNWQSQQKYSLTQKTTPRSRFLSVFETNHAL
jgi:hypothetical protein